MDADALWLTLRLAACTTALLMAVALPVAWWIARATKTHWHLRAIIQALVALPLVLPPTVIGFYLLVSFGPLTPSGRLFSRLFGHPLAFSFAGLLLGSIVFSLPFAVQPLVAGFEAIEEGYLEAATGLGLSPFNVFARIALPAARGSLLTAGVLTFTHTIGEFGVVLMVGGNIPGVTRTLSIALYDRVEDGDFAGAAYLSMLLVLLSLAALLVVYGRFRGRSPGRMRQVNHGS